ncbi:hypothetical protein Golob_000943, partial [Gossypium lobatum]|nr:hypothetical protein [Gossypium lobatum]
MAGNKQKKKPSFFSFFLAMAKKGRIHKDEEHSYSTGEDVWSTRKVYDDDYTLWDVAEPGIDRRASAFIANFHATCQSPFDETDSCYVYAVKLCALLFREGDSSLVVWMAGGREVAMGSMWWFQASNHHTAFVYSEGWLLPSVRVADGDSSECRTLLYGLLMGCTRST